MLLLSHESALEYWRTAGLPVMYRTGSRMMIARDDYAPARALMAAFHPNAKLIDALDDYRFPYLSRPTHLLVPESRMRCSGAICHIGANGLPRGFCVKIMDNVYVVSPELCFAQMAMIRPLPNLLELGYEFCGTFSLNSAAPRGIVNRKPLTSAARLAQFVEKLDGMHGIKLARRATTFILDSSNSPMETRLVLLLCLPQRLGGYGLPQPRLNYRVAIDPRARNATSSQNLYPDMYWQIAAADQNHGEFVRIGMEYDGKNDHSSMNNISRDATRRSVLKSQGIETTTVTWGQLRDFARFELVAKNLARDLGVRLRMRDPGWKQKHLQLKAQLLADVYGTASNPAL